MATLKQSTTYTRMFLLVQAADHISGLTGATAAVTLSKAGGTFGAAGGTVTEVANGWYKIVLTTTDTATLGDLAFHITATSGDPTDFVDQVTANILGDTLPANLTQVNAHSVTDTASGVLDVNAKNHGGTAQTGRDIGASVLLSSGSGTGQISLSAGKVAEVVLVDTLTTYTGNTVQTGDSYARLGAPAGASHAADVAAVKSDTGTILTDVNTGAGAIYNRIGAPVGASISADIAAVKTDLDAGVTVATIASAAASLKKNTAFNHFEFLMTDSTNHNPMTGLTVTATHSIDGAAFASCTNAVAEVASGIYQINLSAADLNGNCITYRFTGTGADDRDVTVFTQP